MLNQRIPLSKKFSTAQKICGSIFSAVSFLVIVLSLQATAETVLVVGDSHSCGGFGRHLALDLANDGKNSVIVYCASGLSAYHWVKGGSPPRKANACNTFTSGSTKLKLCGGTGHLPNLEELLKRHKPDRVVPALGSNNLGLNGLPSFSKFADQLKAAGVKCDWVGPPVLGMNQKVCREYGHNLELLIARIQSRTGHVCRYIDSRNHTRTDNLPKKDCLHRVGKAAQEWAAGVAGEILTSPVADAPVPAAQD